MEHRTEDGDPLYAATSRHFVCLSAKINAHLYKGIAIARNSPTQSTSSSSLCVYYILDEIHHGKWAKQGKPAKTKIPKAAAMFFGEGVGTPDPLASSLSISW